MADKPAGLEWRQSPWDHFVHGFREFGEIASEAICTHCAPTSRLITPLPGARPCLACQLIYGDMLADQQPDNRWLGGGPR